MFLLKPASTSVIALVVGFVEVAQHNASAHCGMYKLIVRQVQTHMRNAALSDVKKNQIPFAELFFWDALNFGVDAGTAAINLKPIYLSKQHIYKSRAINAVAGTAAIAVWCGSPIFKKQQQFGTVYFT